MEDDEELLVGGERFLVRRRSGRGPAVHDYNWVSGPNEGYGFTSSGGYDPVDTDEHRRAIQSFLAQIDPATGFLGED